MIRAYWLGGVAALATLASCVGPPDNRPPAPIPAPVPQPVPSTTPAPLPPATFDLAGEMEQGGAVIGPAPVGTVGLAFDGQAIPIASAGRFLIAFERDHGPPALHEATLAHDTRAPIHLHDAPHARHLSRLHSLH